MIGSQQLGEKNIIHIIIEITISFFWSMTNFTLGSVVSYKQNTLLSNRNQERHWWKLITMAVAQNVSASTEIAHYTAAKQILDK